MIYMMRMQDYDVTDVGMIKAKSESEAKEKFIKFLVETLDFEDDVEAYVDRMEILAVDEKSLETGYLMSF